MRGYSQTVEGNMASAEARALALSRADRAGHRRRTRRRRCAELERLRAQTDAQSQAVVAEFERLRAQTDAQATRAIEDMRSKVTGVSQEVSQHLGSIASRFNETSEDLRSRAARAAADLQIEQERMRAEAERLPIATRESAEAMRASLNDQLRALEQLSSLSARERRDVMPPGPVPPARRCRSPPAYAAQRGATQPPAPVQRAGGGERWSLGDLLARASRERQRHRAPMLDIDGIARALDPTTASAIWSRFRAGQRGIMVRSIYTAEGRATLRRRQPSATARRRFPPHGRPLPGRLRAAGARHRAEEPAAAGAQPPDLRQPAASICSWPTPAGACAEPAQPATGGALPMADFSHRS